MLDNNDLHKEYSNYLST